MCALDITNEKKGADHSWSDIDGTWADHEDSTWEGQTTVIAKESKNDLSVSNEVKGADHTWAEMEGTWADHDKSTWERQDTALGNESKNNLDITNEGNPHADDLSIDDANWSIDDASGTIDAPHITLVNESKN